MPITGNIEFETWDNEQTSSNGNLCGEPTNKVFKIDEKNYTNVLKAVCENIDTYVGMKINFTGYIYRVNDLARKPIYIS